ncbi:MAG: hypothetical protein ACT4NX_03865 [Deltaproteobacteria bacterium]
MKILLCALIAVLFLSSCALAGKSGPSKESLASAASLYYKLFKWKYYDRSSALVDESKRAEYERFIQASGESLNITSVEIKEIRLPEQSVEALVRVSIDYYKYPSVSEKTALVEDVWIKAKDGWRISPDFGAAPFE